MRDPLIFELNDLWLRGRRWPVDTRQFDRLLYTVEVEIRIKTLFQNTNEIKIIKFWNWF